MDEHAPQKHKGHRIQKDKGKEKPNLKGKNPKAFTSQSGAKAARLARRKVEQDQTRLHVPAVDRTFGGHAQGHGGKSSVLGGASKGADALGPPPVIVAVIGPPGVGKSTLIRSLIRKYTKVTMTDIQGPVTVVSGKTRRVTLIECPNELGAVVDIAKIADLVLIMIDGSFGFEMETFEALSAMNAHGLPKIIAILTHLDLIKSASTLKEQKKRLKHRFWTEVFDGAKMFYLSGIINGRYPDREIINLSRFINVAKFRPLTFRNAHPYFLADRIEDITPREAVRADPKMDRSVAVFGYLRGIPLRPPNGNNAIRVHIPGSGVDALEATQLVALPDPCPLPTKESEKRRKLGEKDRLYHAPMSGGAGGQVVFDGDRVWINTAGTFTKAKEGEEGSAVPLGEGEQMIMDLQDARGTLADGIAQSQMRVFANDAMPVQIGSSKDLELDEEEEESDEDASDLDEEDFSDDEDDIDETMDVDESARTPRRSGQRVALTGPMESDRSAKNGGIAYAESDSDLGFGSDEDDMLDEEDDLEDVSRWKANLSQKAADSFASTSHRRRPNFMKLIYSSSLTPEQIVKGDEDDPADDIQVDDEELFQLAQKRPAAEEESFRQPIDTAALASTYSLDEVLDSMRHLFITGPATGSNDAPVIDRQYESDAGSFEDLEGEEDGDGDLPADVKTEEQKATDLAAKKEVLKRKFDEQYDDSSDDEDKQDFYTEQKEEMAKRIAATQAEFLNDDAETRAMVEGYRPGTYVRMELQNVPCELLDNFNPRFPLLVGGLLGHEESFGYVQVRIKKHRWFPKILKTNDPLIFSIGWRRFQTVPVYSLDDGTRNRMLKYTPEHMHCLATFYGPISAPNSGFCAFNSFSDATRAFRVTASGTILDIDGSSQIVKKLKLNGVPYKIFKNTAFIKEMFNSSLEVAKFEGAQIRTVSGIRGQIKKALSKPEGCYRATFEDRVLLSDIVFLRSWFQVQPRKYYNPMSSLLLENKSEWQGMRLTGQVRVEEGAKTPANANSHYKKIERPTRKFNTLKVPRKLQAALPYASKPKILKPQREQTYMQKRAVIMEPEAKQALGLLQQIQAIEKNKVAKRKDKQQERRVDKQKKMAKGQEAKEEREKREKKDHFRKQGLAEKRKDAAESRPSKKSRRED